VIHHWKNQPGKVTIMNKTAKNFNWDKKSQTLTIQFSWLQQTLTIDVQ